jgi:polyisoprenoid-binding protein YceI
MDKNRRNRIAGGRWLRPVRLASLAGLFLLAPYFLPAQQTQIILDPAQTHIEWTLGAALHTVHGTFKLRSGTISFDPNTGNASGEIVVDATSGESGNESRDKKMHKEVLETQRYPEITFLPKKLQGKLATQGVSTVQVQGVFRIHGSDHELTWPVTVEKSGKIVKARFSFEVPYQDWGIKNPSTLFLRVDNHVALVIDSVGKLTPSTTTSESR